MRKVLVALAVFSLASIAATAIHILILQPGDSGFIQCPGGVLALVAVDAEQVEYICNAPTATATATPTATQTSTATPTAIETATSTHTATATIAPSPTATPTATASATLAPTATTTGTATTTRTITPTPTRTPTATQTNTATPTLTYLPLVMRLAVIGDSVQDEYRANDSRGAPYYSTTLNWVELLANERGVDFGVWGTWGEPRRSGYKYNWARSGATSAAALSSQLPGVLTQLRSGEVTHLIIQVGLNDFNQGNLGYQIYSGVAMTATLNYIASNIVSMANQANSAAPGRVLVAGTQDYVTDLLLPEIAGAMPDPIGRARLSAAFAYIDARIVAGINSGVHHWDYDAALAAELMPRRTGNVITVGGQSIVIARGDNEYHYAWLNDAPYAHAGTVFSGLVANIYADAINSAFGSTIPRMTDSEIIAAAGG